MFAGIGLAAIPTSSSELVELGSVRHLPRPFVKRPIYFKGRYQTRQSQSVIVVFLVVALAACFGPAWRAARVSPTSALRQE
jgi:hypothetical protein